MKIYKSRDYNWIFNEKNGNFARWGHTKEADPQMSTIGPELADIEVSTICHRACPWCYKSNTKVGRNMSFETFKKVFDKIPKNITQVAFGIGDIDGNPELWDMMRYCRENDVVPNITINGDRLDQDHVDLLAHYCGAVAVSHYDDEVCFRAIRMLRDAGIEQVNIHKLVAAETYESCINLVTNPPKGVNAIVFLGLKTIGDRNTFTPMAMKEYSILIHLGLKSDVKIGMDSCSANKFLEVVRGHKDYKSFAMMAEPCESTCFSIYVNTDGFAYPCSFVESKYYGINMLEVDDFIEEVWYSKEFRTFRHKLWKCNRSCPHYTV